MAVEIVTRDDLQLLRMQLLDDIKSLIASKNQPQTEDGHGYKTKHVRKLLDCSNGKLQSLRISGKLRSKKVGGTIYYKPEDVKKILNDGY